MPLVPGKAGSLDLAYRKENYSASSKSILMAETLTFDSPSSAPASRGACGGFPQTVQDRYACAAHWPRDRPVDRARQRASCYLPLGGSERSVTNRFSTEVRHGCTTNLPDLLLRTKVGSLVTKLVKLTLYRCQIILDPFAFDLVTGLVVV